MHVTSKYINDNTIRYLLRLLPIPILLFFCNAPRRCRHFVEDAGRLGEGMSSSSRPGAVTG